MTNKSKANSGARGDALNGRVCVVTGAGGGMGRAICEALGHLRAHVVALDNNAEALGRTETHLQNVGIDARAVQVDITSEEQVDQAIEKIHRERGAVDVLVNNAGVISFGEFLAVSRKEWNRIMAVNLTGTFVINKQCLKRMIPRRSGVIVNIGSVAGVAPLINRAHYTTSKAAVHGLIVELAREAAAFDISIYGVAPKAIMSGMNTVRYSAEDGTTPLNTGVWLSDSTQKQANVSTSLVGRLGEPEDVARVVRFLVVDAPVGLRGRILNVDGGYLAGDAITP